MSALPNSIMTEILIIEDDKGLNTGIAIGLGSEKYHFTGCSTLKEAETAVKNTSFDLLILDLNLPDGSGYDFLRKYRCHSDTPVLILTANDLEVNEVMGFELGANDYVTKPFSLAVLRARIENLLRTGASHLPAALSPSAQKNIPCSSASASLTRDRACPRTRFRICSSVFIEVPGSMEKRVLVLACTFPGRS